MKLSHILLITTLVTASTLQSISLQAAGGNVVGGGGFSQKDTTFRALEFLIAPPLILLTPSQMIFNKQKLSDSVLVSQQLNFVNYEYRLWSLYQSVPLVMAQEHAVRTALNTSKKDLGDQLRKPLLKLQFQLVNKFTLSIDPSEIFSPQKQKSWGHFVFSSTQTVARQNRKENLVQIDKKIYGKFSPFDRALLGYHEAAVNSPLYDSMKSTGIPSNIPEYIAQHFVRGFAAYEQKLRNTNSFQMDLELYSAAIVNLLPTSAFSGPCAHKGSYFNQLKCMKHSSNMSLFRSESTAHRFRRDLVLLAIIEATSPRCKGYNRIPLQEVNNSLEQYRGYISLAYDRIMNESVPYYIPTTPSLEYFFPTPKNNSDNLADSVYQRVSSFCGPYPYKNY